MGLESFKSGGTSTRSTTSNTTTKTSDEEDSEEEQDIDDAFKVISADDGRKKVFQEEEDWEKAVDFIESELGMSPGEVENMEPTQRHDVLHQAILGEKGKQSGDFYPTRQCLVCDKIFSFPTNWKFTKFKGEPVCDSHTIEEVIEEYRKMNELHG